MTASFIRLKRLHTLGELRGPSTAPVVHRPRPRLTAHAMKVQEPSGPPPGRKGTIFQSLPRHAGPPGAGTGTRSRRLGREDEDFASLNDLLLGMSIHFGWDSL